MKKILKRAVFSLYYLYYGNYYSLRFDKSYRAGELSYLSKDEFLVWKSSMNSMMKEFCSTGNVRRIKIILQAFCDSKFEIIRRRLATAECSPIVVLCVKNDLQRIQVLVHHYRSIGIHRFAILDNNSSDGTFEWLFEQQDIDLFRCTSPYRTSVKEGWINRIISYYGFDRWYIVTDSDELIVYEDMERHAIDEVIMFAERNGIKRIKGLTLDAYSDSGLYGRSDNIRDDYCWIDSDGYYDDIWTVGKTQIVRYYGGPRYRVMGAKVPLSKCPLVYFEAGTVINDAHYQYPNDIDLSAPCLFGILHYKFIDKDLEEYRRRASPNSGYHANGQFYRQYLTVADGSEGVSFMYEGSIKFSDSSVLGSIPYVQPIPFDVAE